MLKAICYKRYNDKWKMNSLFIYSNSFLVNLQKVS